MNLVLPGFGGAASGHCQVAAQGIISISLLIACSVYFEWIESRIGWKSIFATYLLIGMLTSWKQTALSTVRKDCPPYVTLFFYGISLTAIALILVQPRLTGYSLYFIPTASMTPTLQPGDIILAKKLDEALKPKLGEIVTFTDQTGTMHYIKRVSQKPFALHRSDEDQFYLLGDNSEQSMDSRHMGLIKRTSIQDSAKIVLINTATFSRRLLELTEDNVNH